MADFNLIKGRLMKLEGGYQCYKEDSANYDSVGRLIGTNHGIGARTLEQYYLIKWQTKLSEKSDQLVRDIMMGLTENQAYDIGKCLFWDKITR